MRDEIISADTARDIYGVVVDPETLALDAAATDALREKIVSERGEVPVLQPTEPDSATWLEGHMREGDEYLIDPQ